MTNKLTRLRAIKAHLLKSKDALIAEFPLGYNYNTGRFRFAHSSTEALRVIDLKAKTKNLSRKFLFVCQQIETEEYWEQMLQESRDNGTAGAVREQTGCTMAASVKALALMGGDQEKAAELIRKPRGPVLT